MKSYSLKIKTDNEGIPCSEINIPEDKFFDLRNYEIPRSEIFTLSDSWYSQTYFILHIDKKFFEENAVSMFADLDYHEDTRYNNQHEVVFIKFNNNQIIKSYEYKNDYKHYLMNDNDKWTLCYVVRNFDKYFKKFKDDDSYVFLVIPRIYNLTKVKRKVFESFEDLKNNKKENKIKRDNKISSFNEKLKNTNNGYISLRTPKYEIAEINKPTDYVKNAKVGDIIYGEIDVLNNGRNVLNVASRYVNYITLYVNDTAYSSLPASAFGDILAQNFKLKLLE